MRVHINTTGRFRCTIPVPLCLVSLALKITGKYGMKKYIPEKQRVFIDALDFEELNKAVKILSNYKGMEIVNVHASDGTKVKIIL